jgi:hypothetical protein
MGRQAQKGMRPIGAARPQGKSMSDAKTTKGPSAGATAWYFVTAVLAAIPLAWGIASQVVKRQGVSNFEGTSGYAVLFQAPLWFVLLVVIFVLAYIPMRRSRDAVGFAIALFVLCTIPLFLFVASLL